MWALLVLCLSGRAQPPSTQRPIYFPRHTLTVQHGPPTLKAPLGSLLIIMTPPNYTAQKMKGGGS